METKNVWLLYECDQWQSKDSMVLMGVFTSEESLKKNAKDLIRQRERDHWLDAKGNGWKCEGNSKEEEMASVNEGILTELCKQGSTSGWTTNYSMLAVELDKLEEIR